MVKFSIIVPVYKAIHTLERCVDSLLAQSIKDIEIILVDDGNSDGSESLCDELAKKDSRIHVVHQPNGGPSIARNTGIERAIGEWIIFCDADDEMLPDACELYLKYYEKSLADVIIADIFRIEPNGEERYVKLFKDGAEWKENDEISKLVNLTAAYKLNVFADGMSAKFGYGGPWNKAFKSSLIKNNDITFPVEIRQYEDRLFNMLAYVKADKVVYMNQAVYKYYATAQSVTKAKSSDVFELNDKIFGIYNEFYNMFEISNSQKTMSVVIADRLLFALQNINRGKIGFSEFFSGVKQIKKYLKKPVYSETIKNMDFSMMSKLDRLMIGLLKLHMITLVCFMYNMKSRMKR